MCKLANKKGFSLVELLVVIAIISVLVTLSVGGGKMLKVQAEERLAEGGIEIIVTALELYYDDEGGFPFEADVSYGLASFENDAVPGNTITVTSGTIPVYNPLDPLRDSKPYYWSSQALYYFLTRSVNSNKLIATLSSRLVTNTDAGGVPIVAEVPTGTTPAIDLLRFVDPWGNALRYTYINGNSFPVIESAGSDGLFGTGDDISSQ